MSSPFAPGLLQRLPCTPRKAALLRATRIGDFICATPAFRALRAALPEAEIVLITLPMLEGLAQRSPHIDRFAPFPGYPGLAEQLFEARAAARFFAEMQAERFDLAIQMQGSGVNSNPFMLMLGAGATAGFVRPGDSAGLLDAALPLPEAGQARFARTEIERVLALTSFLGAPRQGLETEYPLFPEDRAEAGALLEGAARPLIGLHPAARDLTRRWDPARFAAVGRELVRRYGGALVLIGEEAERDTAGRVLAWAGVQGLNLAGRTSLGTLGAVIERLALLVTNDTGPAHIAYALKIPTVTVFGGGDPARYGPPQPGPFRMLVHEVSCRPCEFAECPIGYVCLNKIETEQVLQAAEQVINVGGQVSNLSHM